MEMITLDGLIEKISHHVGAERIYACVADWDSALELDEGICAALQGRTIVEDVEVECGSNSGESYGRSLRLVELPADVNKGMAEVFVLSERVRMLVADPFESILDNLPTTLLQELLSFEGEFSDESLMRLAKEGGFSWLALNDGNEFAYSVIVFDEKCFDLLGGGNIDFELIGGERFSVLRLLMHRFGRLPFWLTSKLMGCDESAIGPLYQRAWKIRSLDLIFDEKHVPADM